MRARQAGSLLDKAGALCEISTPLAACLALPSAAQQRACLRSDERAVHTGLGRIVASERGAHVSESGIIV
jgi:hypothetical protein